MAASVPNAKGPMRPATPKPVVIKRVIIAGSKVGIQPKLNEPPQVKTLTVNKLLNPDKITSEPRHTRIVTMPSLGSSPSLFHETISSPESLQDAQTPASTPTGHSDVSLSFNLPQNTSMKYYNEPMPVKWTDSYPYTGQPSYYTQVQIQYPQMQGGTITPTIPQNFRGSDMFVNRSQYFQYPAYIPHFYPQPSPVYRQQVTNAKSETGERVTEIQPKKNSRKAKIVVYPKFISKPISAPEQTTVTLPHPKKNYFKAPDPIPFTDEFGEQHYLRCTCKDGANEGLLIQCHCCLNFLHVTCVNVPYEVEDRPFICPFCMRRKISCKCHDDLLYSVPLIQCTVCGFWKHKKCERLDYGPNPINFVCSECGSGKHQLKAAEVTEAEFPAEIRPDTDRFEVISNLPDGHFREIAVRQLNRFDASLANFISIIFNKFSPSFFGHNIELWKKLIETSTSVFDVNSDYVIKIVDTIARKILYREETTESIRDVTRGHSESISEFIERADAIKFDHQPKDIRLIFDDDLKTLRTPRTLDNGEFICDLPSFIVHSDEVDAGDGIPENIVTVHDTDTCAVVLFGTKLPKRSFAPNCATCFYRIGGKLRVGLFAMRFAGPTEDKPHRAPVVPAQGELLLPFDIDGVPFHIDAEPWREKRGRLRDSNSRKKKPICNVELSLLSAFISHDVPAIPISLGQKKRR